MDFRDSLAADLPAPRDDEPESLRDDILDELADHLACAYRREVMRGADAQTARQRVLEQFGDPAALARRLWFDAMKGRIMKQRILMIYSIVLTLLFVGLVGMLLMQSAAAQRLAREALARAEAERARAEQAQQEMLQKLEAISKAAQSPKSPDWIPVTFKLAEETPDGPPAVGLRASLGKGDNGANQAGAIHRESDDKGMIEFGVVQPGDWEYTLYQSMEDGGAWRTTGKLNVLPGTTIEKTIICPIVRPKRVPLTVHIDWPSGLADRGLILLAELGHEGYTYQPPLHWVLGNPALRLVGGQGSGQMESLDQRRYYLWNFTSDPSGPFMASAPTIPPKGIDPDQVYADLPGINLAAKPKGIELHPGNYRLKSLLALQLLKDHGRDLRGERCKFVAFVGPPSSRPQLFGSRVVPSDKVNPSEGLVPKGIFVTVTQLPGADNNWHDAPVFGARKDQPNHWTIHLPDELIKAVREKLKQDKK